MKLTAKQVKELDKAKQMIIKASLIIEAVETKTSLQYSPNASLLTKTIDLIDRFENEILMCGVK